MITIKQIKKILTALAIAYIPSLIILSVLMDRDSGFIELPVAFCFLMWLLYTFPFFVAVIEVVTCVIRMAERKKQGLIYNIIMMFVALCAVIFAIKGNEIIYFSIALAISLPIVEVIYHIKIKKKTDITLFFKQISLWIIVLAVLLSEISGLCLYHHYKTTQIRKHYDNDNVGSNYITVKPQKRKNPEYFGIAGT